MPRLTYLRTRPDHDPAGFGLFGVSRGGTHGVARGRRRPRRLGRGHRRGFPTRGTMIAYILRWAEIYVRQPFFWQLVPVWVLHASSAGSAGNGRSGGSTAGSPTSRGPPHGCRRVPG